MCFFSRPPFPFLRSLAIALLYLIRYFSPTLPLPLTPLLFHSVPSHTSVLLNIPAFRSTTYSFSPFNHSLLEHISWSFFSILSPRLPPLQQSAPHRKIFSPRVQGASAAAWCTGENCRWTGLSTFMSPDFMSLDVVISPRASGTRDPPWGSFLPGDRTQKSKQGNTVISQRQTMYIYYKKGKKWERGGKKQSKLAVCKSLNASSGFMLRGG